jgi:hypothetical protein
MAVFNLQQEEPRLPLEEEAEEGDRVGPEAGLGFALGQRRVHARVPAHQRELRQPQLVHRHRLRREKRKTVEQEKGKNGLYVKNISMHFNNGDMITINILIISNRCKIADPYLIFN